MSFITALSEFYLCDRHETRLRHDPSAVGEFYRACDATREAIDTVVEIPPRTPEEVDAALALMLDLTSAGEWPEHVGRLRERIVQARP